MISTLIWATPRTLLISFGSTNVSTYSATVTNQSNTSKNN
nr:MAG TPA: hypothetical protein [Bacteriophage sp.]